MRFEISIKSLDNIFIGLGKHRAGGCGGGV